MAEDVALERQREEEPRRALGKPSFHSSMAQWNGWEGMEEGDGGGIGGMEGEGEA